MRCAVAAVAISLSVATHAASDKATVKVVNWSDYIDPSVLDDFTRETGIEAIYDTYDTGEALEKRLAAGKGVYDVVVSSARLLQREIKLGFYQRLDRSKLPNSKGLWPEVMKRLATADPGNQYAVNYMWFTAGIAFNEAKARERLDGADPATALATWEVLFKPELVQRFANCGIAVFDDPDALLAIALNYAKLNPNTRNEADLARAADFLLRIRSIIKEARPPELIDALAKGETCLAVTWAGDRLQARNRARDATDGVAIGYAVPKEGTLIWLDNLAIPKDAPHVEAAYKFIDFLMRPEIAARNVRATNLASGVIAAKALVDRKLVDDRSIYPDDDVMPRLFAVASYEPRLAQTVLRLWAKIKSPK